MSAQGFSGQVSKTFIRDEFKMSVDEFMYAVEQGTLVPVQKANEGADGDLSAYDIYGDWEVSEPVTVRPFGSVRWAADKNGELFADSIGNLWFRHVTK